VETSIRQHFRDSSNALFSSIGVEIDDSWASPSERIIEFVESGTVNLLMCASNSDEQQRAMGEGLMDLINLRGYKRNEIYVGVTLQQSSDGLIESEIDRVTENLQLAPDLLLLDLSTNNQLFSPASDARSYLKGLVEQCESSVQSKKIESYGFCDDRRFLTKQAGGPDTAALQLELLKQVALEMGGLENGFRYICVPLDLARPEAHLSPLQNIGAERFSITRAAELLEIGILGRVGRVDVALSDSLQFARSIPAASLVSSLVSTDSEDLLTSLREVAQRAPWSEDELKNFLKSFSS